MTLEMALSIAAFGWHVVPVREHGKEPTVKWREWATTDSEKITAEFAGRNLNVGIACGPSGLLVIDEDRLGAFAEFAASIGQTVPDTYTVRTGRGRHFYFSAREYPLGNNAGPLKPFGCDVRGDGGYVVAAGSTHPSGATYTVETCVPVADCPDWLADALRRGERRVASSPNGAIPALPAPPLGGLGAVPEVIAPGTRHDVLLRYACSLRERRVPQAEAAILLDAVWARCVQPPGEPYPKAEAEALLEDVYRRYPAGDADPADEWPDLIALDVPDLPPFPVDALPWSLREFVLGVAAETQTPVDASAMLALAVIAAVTSGKARAEGQPGHREELMLYVTVAMGSAERKSAVLDRLVQPLLEIERWQRQESDPLRQTRLAERTEAQAKLKQLRREADKKDTTVTPEKIVAAMAAVDAVEVPPLVRLVLTSATPEALVEAMAENGGRIALFSDESSIFGIMAGRYAGRSGSVDLDVFLHGHNAGRIRSARITRRPKDVDRARLTIGLIVQPAAFEELVHVRNAEGRGLLGRPLYAVPRRMAGTRRYGAQCAVDRLVAEGYASRVRGLGMAPLPAGPVTLACTPEALRRYSEFANQHEARLTADGDLAHIESWAGKHVGQVLRIAALLALWDDALDEPFNRSDDFEALRRILPEHITNAITIGDYLVPHALAALGGLGKPEWMSVAERIVGWVRRRGMTDFSTRDCFTALTGRRSQVQVVHDLERPLALLVERGYIRPLRATERATGRPSSPRWQVNPEALK